MFDMNMNKHFTENAKAAIIHAEVLAHLSRSSLIETSHLLLAIAIKRARLVLRFCGSSV